MIGRTEKRLCIKKHFFHALSSRRAKKTPGEPGEPMHSVMERSAPDRAFDEAVAVQFHVLVGLVELLH